MPFKNLQLLIGEKNLAVTVNFHHPQPPKNPLKAKALFSPVEAYILDGNSFSYKTDFDLKSFCLPLNALRQITNMKFNIQQNLGFGHIWNGLFLRV